MEWISVKDRLSEHGERHVKNGEKIRAMNDDELAWLLLEFRFDAYIKAKGGEAALPDSQAEIVKWLKEDA